MNEIKQDVVKSGKKSSGLGYVNWNLPENWRTLRAQTLWCICSRNADHDKNDGIIHSTTTITPRTTLQRSSERFLASAKAQNITSESVTREMVFPKSRGGGAGLLDDNEVELLSNTIVYSNEANNGMSRNEAISPVQELAQTTNRSAAEGHCDHISMSTSTKLCPPVPANGTSNQCAG